MKNSAESRTGEDAGLLIAEKDKPTDTLSEMSPSYAKEGESNISPKIDISIAAAKTRKLRKPEFLEDTFE